LIAACGSKTGKLAAAGDELSLRGSAARARPSSASGPPVMIIAIDGMSRDLLYDMLRDGQLPNLAELLGGDHLAHAHMDTTLLSTLPSTTMPAWVSAMTGVGPADHGVTGNEYFVRETRKLECPAPVSFSEAGPTLEIYTDGYLDKLIDAPTVYERLRAKDRDVLIWIAMNHVFRGADALLLPNRDILGKAMKAFVEVLVGAKKAPRDAYAALDTGAIDTIVDHLASGPTPDVLTLYLYGTDLYAHVASEGPDRARRAYMKEVIDPALAKVVARMRERRLLERTWTIVIADHGHTEVSHDGEHALGGANGGPPEVLRGAGFRVRPFQRDVDAHDPFSAVLAYGGAMAYVYLADRSQCAGEHDVCAWNLPPRYREDVLPAAEAFWQANERGPKMKGTLDMILVREPRPFAEVDRPFEVYVGDGKSVPIGEYLRAHPHPTYVAFEERMRELSVGLHGERAGDVLLIPHDGDVDRPNERYYFAAQYHSWHGSASRGDSEIPLIVASRRHRAAEIGEWVKKVIDGKPRIERLSDLVIGLREGQLGQ
jgi:hypothetical protein